MPRAVLDANVYVSALLQPNGPPGQIVERFLAEGAFEMILSPAIVDEVLRAVDYPKIRKTIRGTIQPAAWFEDLVVLADLVEGDAVASGVCTDRDDDKYLAAAVEGRADFVVTGDQSFLAVQTYEHVRIVTPRAFLDLLRSQREEKGTF